MENPEDAPRDPASEIGHRVFTEGNQYTQGRITS